MNSCVQLVNPWGKELYKLMKQWLPSHKIGRKRVFLKKDLVRWIKEH